MKIAIANSTGWVPLMVPRQNLIALCESAILSRAPLPLFIDGKLPRSGASFEENSHGLGVSERHFFQFFVR